ncbi:MAG: class I SAM-dependent methyltransferase, partial [Rhodobacteraceae bacterium]|nr:class I SAM-dependent methyltransferase [Paracoccaceae bacterium]
MSDCDPAAAAQSYAEGLAAARVGDRKTALREFLMALALDPSVAAHRRAAMGALRTASGYSTLPDIVIEGLKICAADAELDLQPLAMVSKQIIEADARLPDALAAATDHVATLETKLKDGAWDWLLDNPLLVPMLSRAVNISLPLERLLTALRRHALLWLTQNESPCAAHASHPDVFTAMALQGDTCGFPWPVTPLEQRALARLSQTTGEAGVVMRACYESVGGIDPAYRLPAALDERRKVLRDLAARAAAIPILAMSDDAVSARVRQQYETFPYPPWDAPALDADNSNTQSLRILSAGCGTGQGAVSMARAYAKAAITAIDLSGASLAYAERQAEKFAPGRITFGVGDILSVENLGQSFDLIECIGVLHHMANPAAGLAALTRVLAPGGKLKLALYSERGRAGVVAARALVKSLGLRDTPEDMRTFRQELLSLPEAHAARSVVDSIDFFSLPALHDLVFNVQEHRFTPLGLDELLRTAELSFGGFIATPGLDLAAYRRDNPHDPDAHDLAAWDAFEQRHPDSFANMFLFWARK